MGGKKPGRALLPMGWPGAEQNDSSFKKHGGKNGEYGPGQETKRREFPSLKGLRIVHSSGAKWKGSLRGKCGLELTFVVHCTDFLSAGRKVSLEAFYPRGMEDRTEAQE